jgi:hypothetical protein
MSELMSVICLTVVTVFVMIDVQKNKRKEWANDPLTGLSCCALIVGDIFLVILMALKKISACWA